MSIPALPSPDVWPPRRSSAYSEAGQMLRHYSTSRTAVLSIAMPVCVGILGWALSIKTGRATFYLLAAELVIFLYALLLSLFFSSKYEQVRRCLIRLELGEDIPLYNSVVSARLRGGLQLDGVDKSLILVGCLLHVAFYVYFLSRR
jgi:hypothetical protein